MNAPFRGTLNVQFDVHHTELPESELDALRADLDLLARQVDRFPIADLHVLIEFNARNSDYSVKLSLILPGSTLVANDHDLVLSAAFNRCLMSLTENVRAYKEQMGGVPERQKVVKGTRQEVQPAVATDESAIRAAVEAGDYSAFRVATFPFESSVRQRVGRWVQRYPQVEARVGAGLTIDDVVEEVFLLAFESYESRPAAIGLGERLEGLLDPAVKALAEGGEAELENINLARAARAAEQGWRAV
jgi:hypothetical protein